MVPNILQLLDFKRINGKDAGANMPRCAAAAQLREAAQRREYDAAVATAADLPMMPFISRPLKPAACLCYSDSARRRCFQQAGEI
jgi:hypothetical protein